MSAIIVTKSIIQSDIHELLVKSWEFAMWNHFLLKSEFIMDSMGYVIASHISMFILCGASLFCRIVQKQGSSGVLDWWGQCRRCRGGWDIVTNDGDTDRDYLDPDPHIKYNRLPPTFFENKQETAAAPLKTARLL